MYNGLHRLYQESLQKCKELSLEYTRSEANGKALNALLEQAGEQRKRLRKDFVEQSELATSWRQKHDKLAKESELLHNDFIRVTELLKEVDPLINEIKIKELDTLFRDPYNKQRPIDWNVPQPFPKDYYIPMDTNVISIEDPERVGKTTEKSTVPFLTWSNGVNTVKFGYKLAPLNPTDHPLHPEFKAKP